MKQTVTVQEAVEQARKTIVKLEQFINSSTLFVVPATPVPVKTRKPRKKANGVRGYWVEPVKAALASGPSTPATLAAQTGIEHYKLGALLAYNCKQPNGVVTRLGPGLYGLRG